MYQNILISCDYTVIWPNILTVYCQWSHLKKKKKKSFSYSNYPPFFKTFLMLLCYSNDTFDLLNAGKILFFQTGSHF